MPEGKSACFEKQKLDASRHHDDITDLNLVYGMKPARYEALQCALHISSLNTGKLAICFAVGYKTCRHLCTRMTELGL